MKHYYFNKIADKKGFHEIHTGDCQYLPKEPNRTYLNVVSSCEEALRSASLRYAPKRFDGCKFCCKNCHTG